LVQEGRCGFWIFCGRTGSNSSASPAPGGWQNPEFGFYFLQLISRRLFENLARLESEVAALRHEQKAHAQRLATR
jgi:hypothetical protein